MEKLSEQQVDEQLADLSGWNQKDGAITKTYRFTDFKQAFSAMTRIAFECEAMNHHPDWENVYNTLTIRLNTHDAGGITRKDIELAKTIESLISGNN